jgi:hypothetical protein
LYRAQVNDWRAELGCNRDLLKLVPSGVRTVETKTESRVPFPDGAGETVARVQRSLSRNYLICGGFVYVRGGVPIYAQWKDGNRRTVLVTSSGCGRNVTGKHDYYSPPAYFESYKSQQACYEGRFWLPGAEDEVRRRLTKSQFGCPHIEVCIPDLLDENLQLEIQVDALFRETARLLVRNKWEPEGFVPAGAISMLMTSEKQMAIRSLRGWAISVLQEAHAIRECEDHGWMQDHADPHARQRAFEIAAQEVPSGVSPEAAAVAIEEVLDSIGDTCPECPPGMSGGS